VEPCDELDPILGGTHDHRYQHPLQCDRLRERVDVILVEVAYVLGETKLCERSLAPED
jgi:hypothetical protein